MSRSGDDGRRRRPWRSLLALLALWSLGGAQPLLETIATGPEFLVAHRWLGARVLALAVAAVLLPPWLLWTTECVVARMSRRAAILLHRLWVAMLGACLVLLVARHAGLDGAAWLVAGGLSAPAWLFAYARLRQLRAFVRLLAVSALAVPVVFLLSPGVRPLLGATASGSAVIDHPLLVSPAATAPIVWLVADEWALSTLLTPDGSLDRDVFPNLAALAAESTWYRRAASVSGATELAVPAILGGTLPAPEELPVPAHRPVNLFTLLPEYELWAQEVVSFLAPPERNRAGVTGPESENAFRRQLVDLLSDLRWLYLHRLLPDGLRHRLPSVSDRWRAFGAGTEDREAILERFLPAFRQRLHADPMTAFERFLDALRPGDRQLFFLHLLLPHTPYRYLPDGRPYRLASERVPGLLGERWGPSQARVDQAHQRYLLQTRLLDLLVGRLVARLRDLGMYERAAIVLVSDHGISFHAGALRRTATRDNAHELLPVPLFVKAPEQAEGRVVDEPFSLVDLLPVVLDLVDPDTAPRPRPSAAWAADRLPRIDVGGLEWLEAGFLDRQGAAVEARLARFSNPPAGGIPMPRISHGLRGRRVDEVDCDDTDREAARPAVALDERLLPLGPGAPDGPVSALLRGRVLGTPDETCCDLAVATGGRVAATLKVEARLEPLFSTLVPPPDGSVRPEIYRAVETSDGTSVCLRRLPVRDAPVPDAELARED